MDYRIDAACGSDIGRVRANNEDNFYFNGIFLPQENTGQGPPLTFSGHRPGDECLAVFDGMGGGAHGEAAAFTAAECLSGLLRGGRGEREVETYLEWITERANQAVFDKRTALGASHMGTTQAMLFFHDDRVHVCNVGDSRVFGLRGDRLLKISKDHTDEAYMRERGITGRHPRLTQHLGLNPESIRIEPHIAEGKLQAGDTYLICSDGLTDMVEPEEIRRILSGSDSARVCVERLIGTALGNGGRDNVTVIVVKILETTARREKDEYTQYSDPLVGLDDRGGLGFRHLWDGIKNAAEAFRRHR